MSLEFNRKLRYLRQKAFDISDKELIPLKIGMKKYLIYGNVNLSVFLTDECNAVCKFCVARLRYFHEGVDFVKPKIDDDEMYFERMKEVLAAVKSVNPSVSLRGGEPTLSHRLPRALSILDSFNARKRTITTNGSGLLRRVELDGKTILEKLIDYRLAHLNISRAHFDEKINQEIMQINGGFPNSDLEFIISKARRHNVRPRLSCMLLREHIHTISDVLAYLDWAESMGADNVVFRQIMSFNEASVMRGSIPEYCLKNTVDLNPLWEQIEKDTRFTIINQVLGYYYYVEVYRYRNIDVVFEAADLKQIDAEKRRSFFKLGSPVVYEMVFHPNGNLCGSWREGKEVLT